MGESLTVGALLKSQREELNALHGRVARLEGFITKAVKLHPDLTVPALLACWSIPGQGRDSRENQR